MPRPADLVSVLLSVLLVGASFLLWADPAGGATLARVRSVDGEQRPLALDLHQRVDVRGPLGITRIETGDGRARILSSPCPDGRCVAAGWLTRPGASVVCLPNRVSLDLSGAPEGYDALTF